jgi:type I restriction-modification system DNA methylase subunit
MPFSTEQAKTDVEILVERYYAYSVQELTVQSEANVRANFVDPLFAALGWPVDDPNHYNRETYVRRAGFADIALSTASNAEPVLFVEAKRFGAIAPLNQVQNHRDRTASRLHLPGMSVDRTREEQQAINYAYEQGIRWAVLTNFEHLRLFDAFRDTLVLSFETPRELLLRFDDLWVLSYEEVARGQLDTLRAHRERADVDAEYLELINEWRLRLGRDIYGYKGNHTLLTDPQTGAVDVHKLRDVVQRILDRLVIIRYAEDRLVIPPDQLWQIAQVARNVPYLSLLALLREFFFGFNVQHNGTLFADHLCDRLEISNEVLIAVIENLYDARFRAMSPDIMGNTYEQYLGQALVVYPGDVQVADNLETRKAQGSYYTPEYVVRYIVDHTLGRLLYGTENGRSDGPPIPGGQRKTLDEVRGISGRPLTVLDPASGSGSFLIYAYQVLEEFYEVEIRHIQAERDARADALITQGMMPMNIRIELSDLDHRLEDLRDYKNQILEQHIYGVDLDPQAAELAAVNLMLRAIRRGWRLPLILNQNIKIGNSLVSGLPLCAPPSDSVDSLQNYATRLAELRHLRLQQQGISAQGDRVLGLQSKIDTLRTELNTEINTSLAAHFDDIATRHPFNWVVEFPEVFLDETGRWREDGGFDVVIGNPPYLNIDTVWGQNSPEANYLKDQFSDMWAGKSDYFYYFIRLGLALLKSKGHLGVITARYYLEAYYAANLRSVMLDAVKLSQVVDFGDYGVFPGVGTKTCMTLAQRETDAAARAANQLRFARIPNKNSNVVTFLQNFGRQSHYFSQANLDNDSWNLFGEDIERIITRIDTDSTSLGQICFIGKGMETGRNDIFVVDAATLRRYQIEPTLVRKVVKNQDIKPYALHFRDLYLIYPDAVENLDAYPHALAYLSQHRATLENRAAFKRGDCEWYRFTWPLHKDHYDSPKLVVPFIAPDNRFALDENAQFIGLTDTMVLFPTDKSPDLRYLLALLNSRLLNFRYRYIGKAKDYRYEYVENGLAKIPIKLADNTIQEQLIRHAQTLLDLNRAHQIVVTAFADCLMAREHTVRAPSWQ